MFLGYELKVWFCLEGEFPLGSSSPMAFNFYLLNNLFSRSPGSCRTLTYMLLLTIGTLASKLEISIQPMLDKEMSTFFSLLRRIKT